MKHIITLMTSFLLVVSAKTEPFLISDPYPADNLQPTEFLITGLPSGPITVPAYPDQKTNSVILRYDCAELPKGTYTLTVTAITPKGASSLGTTCIVECDPRLKLFTVTNP